MSTRLAEIRQALTRKLGPLPAWAWLSIFAVAVVLWRRRSGAGTPAVDTNASIADDTAGRADPITLAPGESVYDPATGQLYGSAPEQIPLDPQSTVTLEPGEAAYDPNTGQVVTNDLPDATNNAAGVKSTATKKKHPPSTKHLLAELRGGHHSAAHLAHVRRLLHARGVKIPRTKHKPPKKQDHPKDKHTHKHKPQHGHKPKHPPAHHPHGHATHKPPAKRPRPVPPPPPPPRPHRAPPPPPRHRHRRHR